MNKTFLNKVVKLKIFKTVISFGFKGTVHLNMKKICNLLTPHFVPDFFLWKTKDILKNKTSWLFMDFNNLLCYFQVKNK